MNSVRQIGFKTAWCGVALLLAAGCAREEVRVYQVPKEDHTPRLSSAASHATPAEGMSAPALLRWTLPAGWEEKPATGMRAASFAIPGPDGKSAEVIAIPLAGHSGNELEVVNLWRQSIGLNTVDQTVLSSLIEPVKIASADGRLFDMAAEGQAADKPRIIAAIYPMGGQTWFFKMSGPSSLLDQQKPAFTRFLSTLAFMEGAPAAGAVAQTPVPAAESGGALPDWTVPSHWKAQPPKTMLLAVWSVEEGPAKAEVTVSAFPGDAGGLLANVNRWRRQIGLGPVGEDGLGQLTSRVEVGGTQATVVDVTNDQPAVGGTPQRVVVVIVPHAGQSWFYKISGAESVVAREREGFLKFVQTVRYPNAA
jgi:hypothetical protein